MTFSLPNGIKVAYRRAPGSALFAASLVYRCGVDEEGDAPGIRAVSGWALLRASSGQMARVESLGGRAELDIGLDYLAFKVAVPLSASIDALLLLSTIASGPKLKGEDVRWAKARALKELRRRLKEPFNFALLTLRRGLYGRKGYGLPEWGTEKGLKEATKGRVEEFIRGRLVPKRAFLGVACDIPSLELTALLRATLGLVEGGRAFREPEPPRLSKEFEGLTVREGPGRLARVAVGFPAPSVRSPEFPAAKVLSALLGGGLGGVVSRRLRGEMGLAYRVASLCPGLEGEGYIAVCAEVAPLKVEEATRAILGAISEVRAGNISPSDVERAKNRAVGEELLPLESPVELSFRMALWEALGVGADFCERLGREIFGLRPRAVLEASRRFLSRYHIAVVMPRVEAP